MIRYALALCVLTASPVLAAEAGRYTMTPTEDGYLKLDTATGAVSLCQARDGTFACSLVADDQQALQEEIERLSKRIAELEAAPGTTRGLPDDQELDRALNFMEKSVRRFRDMFEEPAKPALPTPNKT